MGRNLVWAFQPTKNFLRGLGHGTILGKIFGGIDHNSGPVPPPPPPHLSEALCCPGQRTCPHPPLLADLSEGVPGGVHVMAPNVRTHRGSD